MKNNITKGEIIIYQGAKKEVKLDVRLKEETVWLSQAQVALLFGTKRPAITKHLRNIFKDGELDKKSVSSILEHTASDGKTYKTQFYNLDAIISVGYRVNSRRATQFRIWATQTLKNHLISGYTINEKRLKEAREKFDKLQKTVAFLREKSQNAELAGESEKILNLLADYAKTLTLLAQYDKGEIKSPKIKKQKIKFILYYDDCAAIIFQLKKQLAEKGEAGGLFGAERSGAFAGIIKNLYQTFGGKDLYPTIQVKAANLLYLAIKDHPFSDGNKRIGSFLFVYFLDRTKCLYQKNGERKINDSALTALALLIAESAPKEKDVIIDIVVSLIS